MLSWVGGFGGYGDSKAALWSATNSLRIELEKQGTLVTGAHLGYTDTEMTSDFDVPKNDPRDVARQIVDAIDRGEAEVLADDLTRHIKAALSGPVEALRAELTAEIRPGAGPATGRPRTLVFGLGSWNPNRPKES